jgi:hypothetical protein
MEFGYDVDPFQIIPGINTEEFSDLTFINGDLTDSFCKDGPLPLGESAPPLPLDTKSAVSIIDTSPILSAPMDCDSYPDQAWSAPSQHGSSFESLKNHWLGTPGSALQQVNSGPWDTTMASSTVNNDNFAFSGSMANMNSFSYAESAASWNDPPISVLADAMDIVPAEPVSQEEQVYSSSTVEPIPIPQSRHDLSPTASASSTTSRKWIYEFNPLSHDIVPDEFRPQRRRGRHGKLTEPQRENAKQVREKGACLNCKSRKCKVSWQRLSNRKPWADSPVRLRISMQILCQILWERLDQASLPGKTTA